MVGSGYAGPTKREEKYIMGIRQSIQFSDQELVGLYVVLSTKAREEGWQSLSLDEQDWLDWAQLQMGEDDE